MSADSKNRDTKQPMQPNEPAQNALSEAPDTIKFESRRVPVDSRVVLKFDHFGGFFIEYAANISLKGIFIKTTDPKPAGSVFLFEIWLGEEYMLVHGIGEVVWVRTKAEGIDRPAGMGIRYLKLDGESKQVIQRVVEEQVQKGGVVFDLGDTPGAETSERPLKDKAVSALQAGLESLKTNEFLIIPPSEPARTASGKKMASRGKSQSAIEARRRRRRRLLLLFILLLATVLAALYYRGFELADIWNSALIGDLLASV